MERLASGEPPGANRELGAGRGQQRKGKQTGDMAADAGMRHGAQRQAAVYVRWRVWETYGWTKFSVRKGRGERV